MEQTLRIIGCVNAYQDARALRASLPIVRELVDVLVVVDGAYQGFPPYSCATAQSQDDTVDVASMYADVVVFPPWRRSPWPDEVVKRNSYLVGDPGDYYLVVDADEVPVILNEDGSEAPRGRIDVATLVEREDWLVMLKRVGDATAPYPIHRLFRHRTGVRYHGTHHAVHVGDRLISPRDLEREQPDSIFPRLVLQHYWAREPERVERKGAYYEALKHREAEFRARHGM